MHYNHSLIFLVLASFAHAAPMSQKDNWQTSTDEESDVQTVEDKGFENAIDFELERDINMEFEDAPVYEPEPEEDEGEPVPAPARLLLSGVPLLTTLEFLSPSERYRLIQDNQGLQLPPSFYETPSFYLGIPDNESADSLELMLPILSKFPKIQIGMNLEHLAVLERWGKLRNLELRLPNLHVFEEAAEQFEGGFFSAIRYYRDQSQAGHLNIEFVTLQENLKQELYSFLDVLETSVAGKLTTLTIDDPKNQRAVSRGARIGGHQKILLLLKKIGVKATGGDAQEAASNGHNGLAGTLAAEV
jgi:hypothetical protein